MKNFDFIKNRKVFFSIVAVVFVIAIASFVFRGFNVDIDFVGGTMIQLDMNRELTTGDLNDIKLAVDAMNVGDAPDKLYYSESTEESEEVAETETTEETEATEETATEAVETAEVAETLPEIIKKPEVSTVQRAGDGTNVIIKLKEIDSVTRDAVCNILAGKYDLDLTEDLMGVTNVGASVSSDLRNAAIIAIIVVIILMLVYITIRFEILSGLAAILCLAHDIFVMFAAYSLLQIPLNSTMIAAMLTILGYSINATIIVFDRIRENVKLNSKDKFENNVNLSVNQTLTRSLNTTLTTLFTIGMIYIFGVDSIKQFALPIIVGVIAGLFSSVCLSGNIWALLKKLFKKDRV